MKSGSARNESNYNKALVKRGAISLWFDKKSIDNWYSATDKPKKRGRPQIYSDVAVQCMLLLRYIYHLPLRQAQGFVESLIEGMGLPIQAMSYTQLCRRQKTVKLPSLPKSKEPIHIAIDGTGLKIYGEGEWKVRQHGYSKRRDWQKLHIGLEPKTQNIVTLKLTNNHTGENKQLEALLTGYGGPIEDVLTDAGYDYHECYDVIDKYGGVPIISPNINPKHRKKCLKSLRWNKPRDLIRWLQEQLGVERWKELTRYHRRSLVETAFYRFKQCFGGRLMARTFVNQQTEVTLKCLILNKMNSLGLPSHF
jgi:transposase